jgi:hypothetical protein
MAAQLFWFDNRWSQRRICRQFCENGGRCPVSDELSSDRGQGKTDRSAAASKSGSSRKRLAVRAVEERAKSMLWSASRSRAIGMPVNSIVIAGHSKPKTIDSDNGSELTSNAFLSWTANAKVVGTTFIRAIRRRTRSSRGSMAGCATSF